MLNHSNILNNSNIPIHIKIPRTVSRLSGLFKNYSYTNWKTHAAVNRVLTPCQHMIGMNVVRAFSAFCERYNITYWMIGGSLVGSVRHWDIIPWDKDLDFFVPERDKELLERQFPREQHEVPMYMRPGSLKHGPTKIFPESELKVSWPDNFYPFIDIFYYYENETHLWNHSLCCHHHIRKSVVFPLGIRPLGSLWLPAPQKPFGYFKELDPPLFPRVESECYVRGYAPYTTNMMFEQPMIVKCETLSRVYPFVQRTNNNTERLILDGKVLQTIST
ncbi:unnamed protein product [Adineta steineri]|uniref:LicD/FKTN/FKRP nucleotidyltransferase domain-containing protein n=1 Tax=Adineta steineri TaxID=433720 RepID=A0A819VQJ7_9BILA|nr:unnamed protein product [Adineta steineri]CAF4112174.1 unnamed protein product [Adineta steineri]